MNPVTTYLQDTRDIIADPDNWGKGMMYNVMTGQRCLYGAMVEVERNVSGAWMYGLAAQQRMLTSAEQLFPRESTGSLASYNDSPLIDHDDVIAILDKAILAEPFEDVLA